VKRGKAGPRDFGVGLAVGGGCRYLPDSCLRRRYVSSEALNASLLTPETDALRASSRHSGSSRAASTPAPAGCRASRMTGKRLPRA